MSNSARMVNRFGGQWWDFGGRAAVSSQFHIIHTSYSPHTKGEPLDLFYEGCYTNIYADSKRDCISPFIKRHFSLHINNEHLLINELINCVLVNCFKSMSLVPKGCNNT